MFQLKISALQCALVLLSSYRYITENLPMFLLGVFMARLVRDSRLESREARLRLKMRQEPYWRLISEGIHLGYYRGNRGGIWHARARSADNKRYIKSTLAQADDYSEANGKNVLSFSQAQEQARKFAHKISRSDDLEDTKPYTVKTAITDYLSDFKANGKKSYYSTETQINAHILPVFGDKLISALTFKQLNAWKNKLATTDKRVRSSKKLKQEQHYISDENNDPEYQRRRRATANRIITILKAILNHAFHTNRVETNESWQKLKPFKNVSEPKIRFLSEDETIRLINACEPDFRALIRGALLTGARYGELTTLKISDYNRDNHTLFIHQSKSGKSRHIPLNEEGIKLFEQLTIGKKAQDLIFTRMDGKQWKKNYQVRPLEAACNAAKITPIINFHILRHTYGSALAMRGVPLQVIAAALGHSDTRITHKHYAHLMPSYIANVIKQHLPDFGKTQTSNVTYIKKTSIKESI
ncbi:MAG: site-specific integrase [Gammaproteobacteria bacterium]|nr:site-specific integrase [Gammaproteobacteria bacterium]MCW5582938.1 site-specific integrase [Gammaproteobacteria bacterium]